MIESITKTYGIFQNVDLCVVDDDINGLYSTNDEKDDFLLDEEFTESKFEKVFTKFINNKIQNGRMNLITAPINY